MTMLRREALILLGAGLGTGIVGAARAAPSGRGTDFACEHPEGGAMPLSA